MASKTDQLRKAREAKAGAGGRKSSAKSTAKKSAAKSRAKAPAKKSTAKRATRTSGSSPFIRRERVVRSTRAKVGFYDSKGSGEKGASAAEVSAAPERWVVVCYGPDGSPHKTVKPFKDYRDADFAASHPEEWCEPCAAIAAAA
jgi:hypothetical protein